MFHSLDVSASGLTAQRLRMDTIAGNIANAQTTQNEEGHPEAFQRRLVVLEARSVTPTPTAGMGVEATVEIDHTTPARVVHQPGHPHADANGNVHYPNVDIVTEFVNAIEASRAYEANLAAMDISKQMIQGTFRLLG